MGDGGETGRAAADARPRAGPVLACRGLVRSFGEHRAVDGLSFEIAPGEAYGLLGPNGAGKSTTIRLICGLLPLDGGEVGGSITRAHAAGGSPAIGYVPQELALFPTLTLGQNLSYWARVFGVPGRDRAARVRAALDEVSLGDREHDRTDRTSGGMQRRLNLAVALLHRPRLLVLDEPTAGVDAQSRAAVVDTIGRLRDAGTAVLYTSHHLDEAERLCDRVGIVDRGAMVAEGVPAELVAAHGAVDLFDLYLDLTGRDLRD